MTDRPEKFVNELIMEDIFGGKYEDRVDWTHLNTVSYQPETDTIVISPRNLESVVKLNWTTKEIQWILCDPRFWEGTEYEKYVLQPEGDLFISSSSILPTSWKQIWMEMTRR